MPDKPMGYFLAGIYVKAKFNLTILMLANLSTNLGHIHQLYRMVAGLLLCVAHEMKFNGI
jgi:hypothetical protein